MKDIQVVIITGMSGAGKTIATRIFEDLGYFCIDNLPPTLLPKFIDLIEDSESEKLNKLALVMDLRGRTFFDSLFTSLDSFSKSEKIRPKILFLDAKDDALVHRYKETRRSHPLSPKSRPIEGIRAERKKLEEVKGLAQYYIDTTDMKPRELRDRIVQEFASETETFRVNLLSFGFKYGLPIDADLVFDVRFLPNPYYVKHMRARTGLDTDISEYVLKWSETKQFLKKLMDLLQFMIPQYKREGKGQLVIAIGCTGGKHRSVALTEWIAKKLSGDFPTNVSHRDIERGK
ncbi:RNase adapter RapZ [Sporolactobacillus shoreicorticis]|uniref:RNase adapter RapZ n=1 Tax=Sporolactobacillus shoreicorticis TaxID=1923877 RepID=A0ABW5RZ35_9BACL|nr:RNase adapter RapZ [Sporolactobacillus shoreicorticis]MCO7125043.1 RNase adapter RapZ [Sporolactobacillus shoreicorticis]